MPASAPRACRRPTPAAKRLPLEGIRVIDFSMGWAGPICTRTLADLGADVIKIEAIQYPDWWRGVDRRPAYVLEQMYEKSVRYCIMNRNKRGITLDLTRPQGLNWPSGCSPTPTSWSTIIPSKCCRSSGSATRC